MRFNLSDDKEKLAWKYLQKLEEHTEYKNFSQQKFIIEAIIKAYENQNNISEKIVELDKSIDKLNLLISNIETSKKVNDEIQEEQTNNPDIALINFDFCM